MNSASAVTVATFMLRVVVGLAQHNHAKETETEADAKRARSLGGYVRNAPSQALKSSFKIWLEPACHCGDGLARCSHGMFGERAQPGEHGQEHCQTIDDVDRDSAADGNQAVAPGSSKRLGREGVPLSVDIMGVGDVWMLDDCAEAIRSGRGQIVAPCGGRNLLPIDELPRGLEALALGGVHRWLPPERAPTPLGDRTGRGPRAAE